MKTFSRPDFLKDQMTVSSSLLALTRLAKESFEKGHSSVHLIVQESGEVITVPKTAMDLLQGLLTNFGESDPVTLVPAASELSTQKAADMLNMSRPHIVKLMENGEIPFKKVGTHRRVLMKDIVQYREKLDQRRDKALLRLAQQAQALDLGY